MPDYMQRIFVRAINITMINESISFDQAIAKYTKLTDTQKQDITTLYNSGTVQ
jgi:hypothetical protein